MDVTRRNPLFMARRAATDLQSIATRLERAQTEAITLRSVNAPSDGAGRWAGIHAAAAGRADQLGYLEAGSVATSHLGAADAALSDASSTLLRARDLAQTYANGTYGTEERQAAARAADSLREELLATANTPFAGRAVFAGDAWDGDAFDASGAYLGTAATHTFRIGAADEVGAGFDGGQVFQGAAGDAFDALSDLSAALAADDPTAVAATLERLTSLQEAMVEARVDVGFRINRVDAAGEAAETLSLLYDRQLEASLAADPAAAYTRLSELQNSYQAALQVTAASSASKLFDYLR